MKNIQKGLLVLLVFTCSFFSTNVISQENTEPPKQTTEQLDEKKLQVAKDLTDWLQVTLQKNEALVAVVARKGGEDVKKHDITGMAHSGLAIYDPRAKTWIIYNLLNTNNVSKLWRTAPLDFFYGQTGYVKDALILLPDKLIQQRMYEAILDEKYKNLLFTEKYNLLSPYAGKNSLNCNKWLLMNIVAARIDNYDPIAVLDTVQNGFTPVPIHLSTLEKIFVKKKNNVIKSELPSNGVIRTVSIESLYRSNEFFDKKVFYSKEQ